MSDDKSVLGQEASNQIGKKDQSVQSSSTSSEHKQDDLIAINVLGEMISRVFQPIAKSQEIGAKEQTKQTEVIAKMRTAVAGYIFMFGLAILILVGFALYNGKDETAIKIIMGLFGVIGGVGLSKIFEK